ncbi:unnamed protein product [Durusdinium trenchii]|uniref:Uncharacterized protein n=2 Tax=Durusdinium trenchii TaxID=1381693 RepID=A0ABP0SIG2_9DINO
MDLSDLGTDQTLKASAQDLISEDNWTSLDAPLLSDASGGGEIDAAFKHVGNFFMLRLRTAVQSPLADNTALGLFPRPETLLDNELLRSLGIDFDCWKGTTEDILSPGDIIATVIFGNGMIPSMSKAGEQVALMTGSRPPVNFEVEFRERIVQWRDFPSPGLLTLVEIPFDEESQTFVSQSGGHFATVTVVEPHPQNSDQMIVTVGLFVTGHAFPAWASAHLAQMAQSIAQMIHVSAASFQNIELLAEADADFYSVLSLRTCPQGRPLLPGALPEHVLNPNEDPWCVVLDLPEEVEYKLSFWFRPFGEFNFPNYLFLFLAAIGCAEVQVFNSMDGRLLVPYQAVVRRAQWMSVAKRFDAAWKVHKMAYRKLNGTKHAPTISEAKTPRFAEVSDDIRDNPPSIPLKSLITVHNTFIEVDDVPEAPVISRTKSF